MTSCICSTSFRRFPFYIFRRIPERIESASSSEKEVGLRFDFQTADVVGELDCFLFHVRRVQHDEVEIVQGIPVPPESLHDARNVTEVL